MSTLGKVLLFLNLLAAGGLAYLTVQDWSKRQEIQGVLLRYHLTIQGLPVDTPDKGDDAKVVAIDIKTTAGITVQQVSKKLLDAQFSGVTGGDTYKGGGTVVSLLDELNRVEKIVASQVETQEGDIGKLKFLVGSLNKDNHFQPGLLVIMAENFEERTAVRSLAYPPPATPELVKNNLEEARKRLQAKIEALRKAPNPKEMATLAARIATLKDTIAKNPKDDAAKAELAQIGSQGAPPFTRDESDRRRRIALYLLLLDPSAAWQKRVMLVTGLKTYLAALNEQVARVTDIARQTERAIESDQASFERQYDQLTSLATRQDLLVSDQTRLVAGLTEMETLDAASKAARQTQLNDLKTQLAELQKNIAAVLGRQAVAEKAVFELQRKVGDTLQGNLALEGKLDQAEQKKP